MKYRQLRAFRMVMITGSMTQAAERLNMSQPAVSNLIGALEVHFGFPLFERRKGRISPTPDAKRLYQEVAKALIGFEKVAQTAQDIKQLRTGRLRIACMPGLSLVFLPNVVADFLEERPDVSVSLQTQPSPKIQEWIAGDVFDLGIAELPLDYTGIEHEPISFACRCGMAEGHRLAEKAVITPQDLDGEPLITLSRDHQTFHRLRRVFSDAGAQRNIRVETQIFAQAATLASRGVGVAMLDPFTAADYANRGVVTQPFSPRIDFEIGILYPADHPQSWLTREFVEVLRQRLAEVQARCTVIPEATAPGA